MEEIIEVPNSLFDFDSVADRYDRWCQTPAGRMYDRLEKTAMARFLPPSRGKRLLEVGCGTGHWSEFFASLGFEVFGVDISSEMIRRAESRYGRRCRFTVADAYRLPHEDESFDLVAAVTVLEFAGNPAAVIREMFRCLRSGGRAIVAVLNRLAPINCRRVAKGRQPYASAKLLSPDELRSLLEPFGRVRMLVAGFVPERKYLIGLAPMIEKLSLALRRQKGALIVAEVKT